MHKALLVINTGSSSLKFSVFVMDAAILQLQLTYSGQIELRNDEAQFIARNAARKIIVNKIYSLEKPSNETFQTVALRLLLDWLTQQKNYCITAAGHRIVHGGSFFNTSQIINETVLQQLEKLIPLAPLHQVFNIAGVRELTEIFPDIFQVACFDTAFHRTQSAQAQAFALPENLSSIPIKRYGFHGLSYEYITQTMPEILGEQATGKTIIAHLGHGASMCAVKDGRSVATTMGFTALDGLPMGTRCGNIDPGIIFYLVKQAGLTIDEVEQVLYKKSGLLGVSGISSDVRTLLQTDQLSAKQAIELFVYRIQRETGSLVAALGGLDSLIFTAGIGQHSPIIRQQICKEMAWLGIQLNREANSDNQLKISSDDSRISVWVIPTNEEIIIAQHTWSLWRTQFTN